MLFDLRGRRKKFIRVVYMALAVLFAVGLVGFGVGTGGGPGGLFDAIGGGAGSNNSAFEQPIKDAKKRTLQNRKSVAAWLALARANFNLSQSPAGIDQKAQSYNDRGEEAANDGVAAWERYLKLHPKRPNSGVAQFAAQAYAFLGDADGALDAQQIVARAPNAGAKVWEFVALYAFANGNGKLGKQAQQKALALTPKDQRNTVKSTLQDEEKQGKKYAKGVAQQKKAAKKQKGTPAGTSFGPLPGQGGSSGGGLTGQ